MSWGTIAILLLILLFVTPFAQLLTVAARRELARRRCERERGSRVLALVLGADLIATYGLPVARYETLPLPKELAAAIEKTPPATPIDLVVDLPADVGFDVAPVALALSLHPASTTMLVPRRAMRGGVVLAQAAGCVVLGPDAVIGDVHGNPIAPEQLRSRGLGVQEGVPPSVAAYVRRFGEPVRPKYRLPFYVAVPRHPAS